MHKKKDSLESERKRGKASSFQTPSSATWEGENANLIPLTYGK